MVLRAISQWTNAVTLQFDVKDQVASGGPGHFWRVHEAVKRSTSQACSVFVCFIYFQNFIETLNPLGKASQMKAELEKVNDALKKEAQMLARFRHPSLLEVSEAMNDTRISLAFATEPVLANLSNILGNMTNFDIKNISEYRKKHDLDDLEIQKGVLQVTKGLEFLHSNRIVHCNLNPSSIYVNAKGDWKIAGFNFAVILKDGESQHGNFTYLGGFAPYCSPSLDYL
ncbi:SCY1-like protein 2, partial [Nowakowskiella sp. JEL0078]